MAGTPPSSAGIPSAGRSVLKMTVGHSSAGSRPTIRIQFSRPMISVPLSTLWSHYLVDRPENQLTGVGFLQGGYHLSHGQFMDGPGEYTVHRPEHWVFEGTNLSRDDTFGSENTIVGYECDGCEWTLVGRFTCPDLSRRHA